MGKYTKIYNKYITDDVITTAHTTSSAMAYSDAKCSENISSNLYIMYFITITSTISIKTNSTLSIDKLLLSA